MNLYEKERLFESLEQRLNELESNVAYGNPFIWVSCIEDSATSWALTWMKMRDSVMTTVGERSEFYDDWENTIRKLE